MIDVTFQATTSRFDAFCENLIQGLKGDEAQTVLEGVALKFCERMVTPPPGGTPIDTGRARAGWARGLEGLGGSFERRGGDSSAITDGKRRGGLRRSVGRRKGDLGYVAITNGVNYIGLLEYGHSDQAPAGFIRLALEDLRGEFRDQARDDLHKLLEESNAKARATGLKWREAA